MTIQTLISQDVPPLRPEDTVEHALGLMLEVRARHLPVVDDTRQLIGQVSEDMLLDAAGPDAPVASLLGPAPLSARPDTHVFDVTKIMVAHDLTTLPVAQGAGGYEGLVHRHEIFEEFARMLSTHEPGAILALEVAAHDYSLAQLAHSIEQNGARILSIATETEDHSGTTRITLKLNVQDTSRVRHMLEHLGYHVVAAFSESETDEDFQDRIQQFLRYLEV